MPIVVNGTTIPENVANVLNVNGTNITSVMCNGTTVWTQSLFSALWSGDSLRNTAYLMGIDTSGSNFRAFFINDTYSGQWSAATTSGTFTVDSIGILYSSTGYSVSGNLIRGVNNGVFGEWITYTLATKSFSGTSAPNVSVGEGSMQYGLVTSGGLIAGIYEGNISAYISLT